MNIVKCMDLGIWIGACLGQAARSYGLPNGDQNLRLRLSLEYEVDKGSSMVYDVEGRNVL